MYKVLSSSLLVMTLVCSTAHAPTFHLWRHLAQASTDTATSPVTDYLNSAASLFNSDPFAATREYAEDNDLHRFGLDEFYLPTLDVDLPELFEWSEGERDYLASNALLGLSDFSLDNVPSIAFRSGGANIGYVSGAGFSSHAGGVASIATQSNPSTGVSAKNGSTTTTSQSVPAADSNDSVANDTTNTDSSDSTEPTENQLAKNEPVDTSFSPIDSAFLPPVIDSVRDYPIVEEQKPVQVPAPGAFGLFVLGLAGLRFVGRKKNGSG